MRRVLVAALVLALAACSSEPAGPQPLESTIHNVAYRTAGHAWDWRTLWAQCWVESAGDETAVSPAGAEGLCQIMPATQLDLGVTGSIFRPQVATRAAARYMRRLRAIWPRDLSEHELWRLALASYHAGPSRMRQAAAECDGRLWAEIAPCVSPWTRHYVARVERAAERLGVTW